MDRTQLCLETPIIELSAHRLPRIGKKTSENLAAAIATINAQQDPHDATVGDLLNYFPMRYEDRSNLQSIGDLIDGIEASVEVEVRVGGVLSLKGGRIRLYEFLGADGTGQIRAFWWNQIYLSQVFKRGGRVILFGQWRFNRTKGIFEIENPEFELMGEDDEESSKASIHTARRVPIYRKLGDFKTRQLRSMVFNILEKIESEFTDPLPAVLLERCRLVSREQALRQIHFPGDEVSIEDYNHCQSPAHRRLIFEEFFWLGLALGLRRKERQREPKGEVISINDTLWKNIREVMPFKATAAQERVLREIVADMVKTEPMNRLLQGDVGSGKTIVAIQAILVSVMNGYQAALMAPTELLAEQHARNAQQVLKERDLKIELLTGSLRASEKRRLQESLKSGQIDIIIGTHALIQESVEFSKLGLVVIDEQHRFGVEQRKALQDKGKTSGMIPHQLVMTATPIPRTLAMTAYADLDVSVIDELPPGRTPVKTVLVGDMRRDEVINRIKAACQNGRQAYWVCTLIEESEVLACQAAENTALQLTEQLAPLKVGLIHGRLKSDEKAHVMSCFKAGDIQVLVATTVIEVGVDVPNASLMIIENPERLGLAQLHQLRGRVGRGSIESFCVLLYHMPISTEAMARLAVMRETNDGFLIAEKDLELRGPGEVLGTRQTGAMEFKMADLVRDRHLLPSVQSGADFIFQEAPHHVEPLIHRWIGNRVHYAVV
ncbi:MAG: ATP-dependent DNA helicase RecG [Acidobacteria bacterium]|nr:ATP-dependent DNA helicase RecG [Acidobacteriota bacterium]